MSPRRSRGQGWNLQRPANPNSAAHFRRYVYKLASPLATIDPGLWPQFGGPLFLEAHALNSAGGRAIDSGTALDRFAGVRPSSLIAGRLFPRRWRGPGTDRRFLEQADAAVLMVTHDLFLAREVGSWIGLMREGKLRRMTPAGEITPIELERLYLEEMGC